MSRLYDKAITVQLLVKTAAGHDELGAPEYTEEWIDVDHVLVGEPSADDAAEVMNLYGKRLAYTLAIPKGDTHEWEDTQVQFFGEKFRTIGAPVQGIDALIPLEWNKKVKVERYE